MYELVELYDTQPQTKKINMQFKNIKDLTQMIAILAKFRFLSEVSFHGNKLTSLPSLQSLKNLRAIDLSNNPIKIDRFLLDRLHQTPKLEEIFIDCNREERESIVENVPNLKAINGESIIRQRYVRQTLEEELKMLESKLSEEMKKMKEVYSKLSLSVESPDSPSSKGKSSRMVRNEEFNLIFKDIQQEMNYFYSGLQDKLSREGVFAYCKNKMTVILDNLMIKILDETASQAVVKIYEEVSKIKNQNFDLLLRIIFNASYEKHVNEEIEKPINRLRKETIYQNQIFRLKKEILEIKKQQGKIQQIFEKETNLKEKQQHKPLLSKSPSNPKGFERSSSVTKLTKRSPSAKSLVRAPTLSRSPSVKTTTNKPVNNLVRNENQSIIANRGQTPSKTTKTLTLDQLLKLIQEIMVQKRKFNLRSLTKNEVFETSEEFIFTFFSRKYGLKEVALQWSLSLIKAIEVYCRESIDVEIFGKILKNQLYEQYYDEFKIFGKEIEKVYRDSRADKNCIQQSLFRKIFFYFFSYQNDQTFQKIVKSFTFPITQAEHTYFLQSYKLAFEEKHLTPFLQLFDSIDKDDDSTLSAKEAKELIYALIKSNKQFEEEATTSKIQEYSAMIDTFKKNRFIFSELFQIAHPLL